MCQRRQKSMMLVALYGELKLNGSRMPNISAEPDRHVGVAGEIEIDLEGVGERRRPTR